MVIPLGSNARTNGSVGQMATDEPLDSAIDWVAEHTRQYVENGGGDAYIWRGFPTVVLTTRGRKSGALRRNALIYGRDGDDFILIASYGGRPKNPLWYLNLVADPHVSVQEQATVTNGVAETVENEAERTRLWDLMVSIYPPYADYAVKAATASRTIPVVRVRAH
jgi:deazaflavin-dependent oxidoreductase (nitroreductase family)